jgi:hypothetical protein
MKHITTGFTPYVNLSFTDHEIEVMIYCAQHHYDLKCNKLVKSDGMLFKMKKLQDACGPTVTHTLEFQDMDTINKALEIGSMIVAANVSRQRMVDTSAYLMRAFYQLFNDLRKVTPNPINHE